LGKPSHVLSTNLHIFDPLSLHKKCVCENEGTTDYHHGSSLKVRNTCRCSLTQRLVRWCSPWFPKYGSKPKQGWRRVNKWATPRRSKRVVYFQRYYCFSVSFCSVRTWEKGRLQTLKTTQQLTAKNHPCNQYFVIPCLRFKSRGVH